MRAWALDLDGVVWRGDVGIAGSAAAVERLRAGGDRVVFLTNNSALTVADYLAKLDRLGVPAVVEDLVTSAQAAAGLLEPGSTALVAAGPGVTEALETRGVTTVLRGPADAVVVGWHRDFDYDRLTVAMEAVLAGARLIGTNDDATYPTPSGVLPGGGAILAAVAYASSTVPEVAGKPNEPMAALVASRVGRVDVMVGDRPSTDGLMAKRMGARFGLVLSGVTARAEGVDPAPDMVAADLAGLVEAYAAG
jgi:HAD superfamily hydrolase (TIGR01450 family)